MVESMNPAAKPEDEDTTLCFNEEAATPGTIDVKVL